jgi:hypothetical protein
MLDYTGVLIKMSGFVKSIDYMTSFIGFFSMLIDHESCWMDRFDFKGV